MSTNEAVSRSGVTTANAAVRVLTTIARPVFGAMERAMAWQDRWRQRQALQSLDDFLLKDIGLTRSEVERESTKPFWKD